MHVVFGSGHHVVVTRALAVLHGADIFRACAAVTDTELNS
jgi:hypothetical protein